MAGVQSGIAYGLPFFMVGRSNVTAGAEWIGTRFGKEHAGHNIVVVFALISCLGFLATVSSDREVHQNIPWEVVSQYIPFDVKPEFVPHLYGIVFTALLYSILSWVACRALYGLICFNML